MDTFLAAELQLGFARCQTFVHCLYILNFKQSLAELVKAAGFFMTEIFIGVVSCSLALYLMPWHTKTHKAREKREGFKNMLKFMLESVENLTTLK